MKYLAAWPTHAHLLLVEILAAGPAGVAQYRGGDGRPGPPPDGLHDAGSGSGAVSADALVQARFGALHRLVQQRVLAGEHQALPRLTPTLVELVTLHGER